MDAVASYPDEFEFRGNETGKALTEAGLRNNDAQNLTSAHGVDIEASGSGVEASARLPRLSHGDVVQALHTRSHQQWMDLTSELARRWSHKD